VLRLQLDRKALTGGWVERPELRCFFLEVR
jgi:hypothetical protein